MFHRWFERGDTCQQYCIWGYQDNFKSVFLLFFFYEKILSKEAPKHKINGFHLLRSFCAREILLSLLFIVCLILFCQLVLVWFAFLRSKSFCQKSKETWNCPDNVKYNTSNRGLFYWLPDNSKNTGIPSSHFFVGEDSFLSKFDGTIPPAMDGTTWSNLGTSCDISGMCLV